ncbi:MAG TPA: hypothetical protein VGN00_17810 [Puia sp.]|jgi:hypothetical protein
MEPLLAPFVFKDFGGILWDKLLFAMPRKRLILAFIPLIIIAGLLIYTWSTILFTDICATWKHWLGFLLFLPLPYLVIKKYTLGLFGTGIYLLLGTFNLLALTPTIYTNRFFIGSLGTPAVQLLLLGIFVLYAILNFNAFVDIYVDYKVKS